MPIGETLLLGGAGLVRTGLGLAGALDRTLPETWLGRSRLNATFIWPSVVGIRSIARSSVTEL